nr:MAG TPA: hypothetical protein [Caudoviricetes sp.]
MMRHNSMPSSLLVRLLHYQILHQSIIHTR